MSSGPDRTSGAQQTLGLDNSFSLSGLSQFPGLRGLAPPGSEPSSAIEITEDDQEPPSSPKTSPKSLMVEIRGHKNESIPLHFKHYGRQQLGSLCYPLDHEQALPDYWTFRKAMEKSVQAHLVNSMMDNVMVNTVRVGRRPPKMKISWKTILMLRSKVIWENENLSPTTIHPDTWKRILERMGEKEVLHVIIDMDNNVIRQWF